MVDNKPWLKQYPVELSAQLEYHPIPIHQYLINAAKEFPQKTAIHFMGKEITYHVLYEKAMTFANYLKEIGLKQGERVAIMLPNIPQTVICYYGILMAGGIVVQTNPLYTEREIKFQMKDSGATFIVTLDILYPRVAKVMANTNLQQLIITAIKDFLPFPKNLIYPWIQKKQHGVSVSVEHKGNLHLLKRILKTTTRGKLDPLPFDFENDVALLQYTGGTTGRPKGAMLTHKNLIANATMCAHWMYKGRRGQEVVLGLLPLFHVYGMTTVLILSVMQGYKMVLLPRFDLDVTLKTIEKQKPTLFPGAPTMYIGLLNHPNLADYDLSSIDACISGSAPLPVEVQQAFEKVTGGKLVEGYGLTESSPVTHANFLWDRPYRKGSIGVPWPDTDAAIRSMETGELLPPGEIGEVIVKGPQVMKGYWNQPEETANTLKDGWLFTGDLGYMDEDGYFYIVERKSDMIIASGYNIYPREIEEIFYELPEVQEVVAVGIPDAYRGETVKLYVVLREGAFVTAAELENYARKHLSAYKVPRKYEFRSKLPKTAIGKVLRRSLIEEEKKKMAEEERTEK